MKKRLCSGFRSDLPYLSFVFYSVILLLSVNRGNKQALEKSYSSCERSSVIPKRCQRLCYCRLNSRAQEQCVEKFAERHVPFYAICSGFVT